MLFGVVAPLGYNVFRIIVLTFEPPGGGVENLAAAT